MPNNNDSESWNEWQKIMSKIAAKQSKMLQASLAPAIKQIEESVNQMMQQHSEALQNSLEPLVKQMQESTSNFIEIGKLSGFKALLQTIEKEVKEIPDHVDKVQAYLAKQGWFVPFHLAPISIFKEYSKLIDNKEYQRIENDLQDFIKSNISFIEDNVERQFPNRYRIIKTALEAHEKKNYLLSIPTLLAQADGMFSELIDKTFYSNKKSDLEDIRRRILKKLAQNNHPTSTSSLGYLLIKQLQEKSIIHENFEEFEKNRNNGLINSPLNRNYILHGKDLNYDSEANSLRTIALIGLLCDCKETFSN